MHGKSFTWRNSSGNPNVLSRRPRVRIIGFVVFVFLFFLTGYYRSRVLFSIVKISTIIRGSRTFEPKFPRTNFVTA